MTPRPTRIVRNSLLRKGFAEKEHGDHRKLYLDVEGATAIVRTYYTGRLRFRTVNSHGARECDDYILGQMAMHLRLSRARLNDLIDCEMSGEEYVEMLRGHGYL